MRLPSRAFRFLIMLKQRKLNPTRKYQTHTVKPPVSGESSSALLVQRSENDAVVDPLESRETFRRLTWWLETLPIRCHWLLRPTNLGVDSSR